MEPPSPKPSVSECLPRKEWTVVGDKYFSICRTFNAKNCGASQSDTGSEYTPRCFWSGPKDTVSTYKVVTSGTCESNGYKRIMDKDTCKAAAADAGFVYDWGPEGGYKDLVDGCSYRWNLSLFLNSKAGTCTSNACDCSRANCLCEA